MNTWFNGPLSDPSIGYYPPLNNIPDGQLGSNIGHRPLCSTVVVQAASYLTITMSGVVHVLGGDTAVQNAQTAFTQYLTKYAGSVLFGAQIYYSLILATLQNLLGPGGYVEGFKMAPNGQPAAAADVQVPQLYLPNFVGLTGDNPSLIFVSP